MAIQEKQNKFFDIKKSNPEEIGAIGEIKPSLFIQAYRAAIQICDSKKMRKGSIIYKKKLESFTVGIIGELIIADFFQSMPNLNPLQSGDGGVDMIVYGQKIQVKTCQHFERPELKIECDNYWWMNENRLYFLVAVDLAKKAYKICGYATPKMVVSSNDKLKKYYEKGKWNFFVKESQLKSTDDFFENYLTRNKDEGFGRFDIFK